MDFEMIDIKADNVNAAAGEILGVVEDTSKANVMYFSGWSGLWGCHGFGASAALRVVAQRLESRSAGPGLKFDKVIHVDCSVWKSRRALQKAVAEELELPRRVMAIFDQRDEEDDFQGVDEGSRGEIPDVTWEIFANLAGHRFVVVFHNGSGGYIDLNDFGVPVHGYLRNRMLWTDQGRFAPSPLYVMLQKEASEFFGNTGVFLGDRSIEDISSTLWGFVHEEAEEVAKYYTGAAAGNIIDHRLVEECVLYMWALRGMAGIVDWGTHASNYWVCDGIIQCGGTHTSAWEIGDALQRYIRLDWNWKHMDDAVLFSATHLQHDHEPPRQAPICCLSSSSSKITSVPPGVTSFFLAAAEPTDEAESAIAAAEPTDEAESAIAAAEPTDEAESAIAAAEPTDEAESAIAAAEPTDEASTHTTTLPAGMFQHSGSSLRVLHLSRCTFSFASPPFLCCSDLRFLLLDHCKDDKADDDDHTTSITEIGATPRDHGAEEKGNVQTHSQSGTSWRASCFLKLWVLDLSYTDWYWLLSEEMMSAMADLRELNVKGIKHWSISDLRGSCRLLNLVKIQVTAEPTDEAQSAIAAAFPNLSSASSLKTVILDGCVGLQQVCPDALPASLESFSFSVDAATQGKGTKQISSISFRGCARLKSLLLRGLFGSLEELDISGTAVKTLDLRALKAPGLRRLLLSGCEKLRAILWPPGQDDTTSRSAILGTARYLELLRIDTTSRSAPADGGEENLAAAAAAAGSSSVPHGGRLQAKKEESFNKWRISLTDARLLRSLLPVAGYFVSGRFVAGRFASCEVHICVAATVGGSIVQAHTSTPMVDSKYRDVFREAALANNNYVDVAAVPVTMMTWDCPEMPLPWSSVQSSCIIELITQGQGSSKLLEGAPQSASTSTSTSGLLLPDFVCDRATSLHVYDNSSITTVPAPAEGARWNRLGWCRVERCPKVHTVFATPQGSDVVIFYLLSTFWASQLPTARYLWNWNWPSTAAMSQLRPDSFQELRFLHLDCCPRLIHVLPLLTRVDTLWSLETLEIVCCDDLREVFPLDPESQEQGIEIRFPRLRRIHLHELPMLQRICGRRMSTPSLATVNIRGCWSLRRLPPVGGNTGPPLVGCWSLRHLPTVGGNTEPPLVDCEKEWWDRLEWDGPQEKHHPSLYRPRHSHYCKKTQLPKGSILR